MAHHFNQKFEEEKWLKVPICTWVEWSNYGKVPYSKAKRVRDR